MIQNALELLIAVLIYGAIAIVGIGVGSIIVAIVVAVHKQITEKK